MRATAARVSEISTSSESMTSFHAVSVDARGDTKEFMFQQVASLSTPSQTLLTDAPLSLSPGWVTGHSALFQTPKSVSPVSRKRTRRSVLPAAKDSDVFKKPVDVFISPTGVKTRARRSSIYQKSGKNLLTGLSAKSRRESMAAIRSKKYASKPEPTIDPPKPSSSSRNKLIPQKKAKNKEAELKKKSASKSTRIMARSRRSRSKLSDLEKSTDDVELEEFSPRRTRKTPSKKPLRSLSSVGSSTKKRRRSPSRSPKMTSSNESSSRKNMRRSGRTKTPSVKRKSLEETGDISQSTSLKQSSPPKKSPAKAANQSPPKSPPQSLVEPQIKGSLTGKSDKTSPKSDLVILSESVDTYSEDITSIIDTPAIDELSAPKTSPKSKTPLSTLKMKSILDSVTSERHSTESGKKRKTTDFSEPQSSNKRRRFDREKFERIISSTPRDIRLDILSGRRPELSPITGSVNKNTNNFTNTKQVTVFSDKSTFSTTGPSNLSPIVTDPLKTSKLTATNMYMEDDEDEVDIIYSQKESQPYLFDYDTDIDTSHSNVRSGCIIL